MACLTKEQKARLILKGLEKYISVDSAFEEFYIKGILIGLSEIDKKELAY